MSSASSGTSFGQALVSQRPVFGKGGHKRAWCNTVKGRRVFRPDKRQKSKFLK